MDDESEEDSEDEFEESIDPSSQHCKGLLQITKPVLAVAIVIAIVAPGVNALVLL